MKLLTGQGKDYSRTPAERVPKPLRRAAHVLVPRNLRSQIFKRWFRKRRPFDEGFAWVPPLCPPGMVVAPPDFIGVGVGRSGTTWWFGVIEQHSRVHHHHGLNKERQYLRHHLLTESPGPQHRDAYAAWFPRPPGMLAGEWTPWYLGHAWLGQALRVVAPDAKLLVILRDPIERYISGITNELKDSPDLRPGSEAFHFNQGLYSFWLRVLEPYIARDRLLVLQYERCMTHPEQELTRIQRHLGLETEIPSNLREHRNQTLVPKLELDLERRKVLIAAYEQDVSELVARYPEIDRSLWPNFT
jgi:hypothetical protein